jgi:NAD(P)-dependent dehydrogenase (short-subunit alcohol dehydrogenase family)
VKGKAGQTAYSASKAAVLGLSRTAAIELSEYNIQVNVLLPGYMMTEMGMKAGKAAEKARAGSISGRLSRPEDVADFVAGVLRFQNVTGQIFSLDTRII